MSRVRSSALFDRLVSPLGNCLTRESARRIVRLKADARLQAHVDDLAARHRQGKLTPEEQADYDRYISFNTFVAILKSKARQLLAGTHGE